MTNDVLQYILITVLALTILVNSFAIALIGKSLRLHARFGLHGASYEDERMGSYKRA